MNEEYSRTGTVMPVARPEALGLAVRHARRAHGLTQAQLAGLAGTGPRFISDLERGKPTVELGKVLDVLDVLALRLQLVGVEA